MATSNLEETELDVFQRYIEQRGEGSLSGAMLSQAIEEFREYQRQLLTLREKLQASETRGEKEGIKRLSQTRLDSMCDAWEAELHEKGNE